MLRGAFMLPANPRAWLVSAGRFKAIDAMRRRARFDTSQAALAEQFGAEASDAATFDDESIEDDRLRLNLHLLSSSVGTGSSRGTNAAGGVRSDDRGDWPRFPHRSSACASTWSIPAIDRWFTGCVRSGCGRNGLTAIVRDDQKVWPLGKQRAAPGGLGQDS
jgi:hypothetical protein